MSANRNQRSRPVIPFRIHVCSASGMATARASPHSKHFRASSSRMFFALVQTCVTTSRWNACFNHYCPYYGIADVSRKNSNPLGHLAPYVAIALDHGHQMTPDETVKSTPPLIFFTVIHNNKLIFTFTC